MRAIYLRWYYVFQVLVYHLRKNLWIYGLLVIFISWFQSNYMFAVNISESLPDRIFIVDLHEMPTKKGDYIAFHWDRDQFYKPSSNFVKVIAGTPGQKVTVSQRNVYVDGNFVGFAKPASKRGIPLTPIQDMEIPTGSFYVRTPHLDSLDSRYTVTGLVEQSRIIGKAYAIF